MAAVQAPAGADQRARKWLQGPQQTLTDQVEDVGLSQDSIDDPVGAARLLVEGQNRPVSQSTLNEWQAKLGMG